MCYWYCSQIKLYNALTMLQGEIRSSSSLISIIIISASGFFHNLCQAGHTSVPTVDQTNIEDTTPDDKPRYLKNPTSFKIIDVDDGSIAAYADDQVHSVAGTYSTWVDKESGEYFLYIRPVLLSKDKPDRVTIFAQISGGDNYGLTQSVVCDLYSRVESNQSPNQINEQMVFHSVDKAILKSDSTTYNGVALVNAINELTWEQTWRLSIEESYIGPQFDHLGYTAPVYTDLYEYSCGFYRAFE